MIATLRSRALRFALGTAAGIAFAASGVTVAGAQEGASDDRAIMLVTLPLHEEALDDFMPIMHENVRESRAEPGNIAFNVYSLEDGGSDLFLVELWESEEALASHMETPHLGAVETAVETALRAPATTVNLVELSPTVAPAEIPSPATTRNVIVSLQLLPEERDAFVEVLLDTVEPSRSAPGNLGFDVYQDIEDPNAIVLVERWESAEAHEAHLEQDYNEPLNAIFESSIAEPLVDGPDGRRLAQDVSEG